MAQSDISHSAASAQSTSQNETRNRSDDEAAGALQARLANEASNLGNEAKGLAQDVAGRVGETAKGRIASGKDRAARSVGSVADALRQTGQQLRRQDEENLPGYIDTAADKLESVSGYLRDKELSEVVEDIEDFARREPALFIGGAFAIGLLGGRFLKSSAASSRARTQSSTTRLESVPPQSSARLSARSGRRGGSQHSSELTTSSESPINGEEATSTTATGATSPSNDDLRPGDA